MSTSSKTRLVTGSNWVMVGLAIAWIVYLGVRLVSTSPEAQGSYGPLLSEPPTGQNPTASRPQAANQGLASDRLQVRSQNQSSSAAPAGATASNPPAPAHAPGPVAQHPGTPQPPLNPRTLPPGAGKDF